jgi:arginine-tRNA-protein transferase
MVDTSNILFDSKLIEVRDGGKLIAAGIFDQGSATIAGIKNIYHPEYKKYSLGKYMILLKYQYCLQQGIKWYYPGYFAPENPKFNYKIDFDKNATEVCLPPEKKQWIPLNDFVIPEWDDEAHGLPDS